MYKAFTLVRNVESSVENLDFGDFAIRRIGPRFEEFRSLFLSLDVDPPDWILEKFYLQSPPGFPGDPIKGIKSDTENILVLLRLYRTGEITFIKQAIVVPTGDANVQRPYQAMNDLNGSSDSPFQLEPDECGRWKAFANDILQSQSWGSDWFGQARRFFLYGAAKRFDPDENDLDRIVDYTTALESTLVPEKGYNARRVRRRAAALIAPGDAPKSKAVAKLIKQLYEIRSRIVHGGKLGDETKKWLSQNWPAVELRVRDILTAAVRTLPPREEDRRVALARLYDLTDADRAEFVIEKFREVKTATVRKELAAKIAQLIE